VDYETFLRLDKQALNRAASTDLAGARSTS
jgi:hypothetical protein